MEKKAVGKKAEPTAEELEFIHSRLEKLSDQEVLEEMQDESFPVRSLGFIKRRRREFNAVKKALETTLKQQIDPAIAKAKDEHLAEIRNLIEEWKDAIKTPKIDEMSLNDRGYLTLPFSKLEYQFNPLFDCLEEHLPIPSLWQNHSLWIHKIPDYFDRCKNLIKEITEDDRVVKWLEEHPKWEEHVVVEPVLRCISDRALGKEIGLLNQPNPETGELEPFMEVTEKPGTGKFLERKSRTRKIEQITVERICFVDPAICTYYLNCKEATHVVDLFNEMRELELKICESLQEILSRRDYIWHTCRLCPGQQT